MPGHRRSPSESGVPEAKKTKLAEREEVQQEEVQQPVEKAMHVSGSKITYFEGEDAAAIEAAAEAYARSKEVSAFMSDLKKKFAELTKKISKVSTSATAKIEKFTALEENLNANRHTFTYNELANLANYLTVAYKSHVSLQKDIQPLLRDVFKLQDSIQNNLRKAEGSNLELLLELQEKLTKLDTELRDCVAPISEKAQQKIIAKDPSVIESLELDPKVQIWVTDLIKPSVTHTPVLAC